jgi:hypothetical protein
MIKWFKERRRLRLGKKVIDQFNQNLTEEISALRADLHHIWDEDLVFPECERFNNTIKRLHGQEVTPEAVYSCFERALLALKIENRIGDLKKFKHAFIEVIELKKSPLRDSLDRLYPDNHEFFDYYFLRDQEEYEIELENACAEILEEAESMLENMIELKLLLSETLHKKQFRVGFLAGLGNFLCGGIDLASNVVRVDDTSIMQLVASDLFVSRIHQKTAAFRKAVERKGLSKVQVAMDQFLEGFQDLYACATRYHQHTRSSLAEIIEAVIVCETHYHQNLGIMLQEMLDAGMDIAVCSSILESSPITYHSEGNRRS